MDEEEYSQRRIKLAYVLSKATFITSLKMNQKTKKASLLAEEADLLQDERDKAVYWSIVMSAIEAQAESRTVQRMTTEMKEKD
jgi:RecA-family ATPase